MTGSASPRKLLTELGFEPWASPSLNQHSIMLLSQARFETTNLSCDKDDSMYQG